MALTPQNNEAFLREVDDELRRDQALNVWRRYGVALIRQTSAEFDALKPEVVAERMRPLAVAGNPWLGSAGELMAAAYLQQGRRDLAGQVFARIAADTQVPASLRQRAVQMAGVLDGASDNKATPASPTAAGAAAPATNEGNTTR